MRIEIELIGHLRTRGLPNGFKGGALSVADSMTMAQLLELLQVSPDSGMLPAVNGSVRNRTYALQEGDVIQFAPAIAGG